MDLVTDDSGSNYRDVRVVSSYKHRGQVRGNCPRPSPNLRCRVRYLRIILEGQVRARQVRSGDILYSSSYTLFRV